MFSSRLKNLPACVSLENMLHVVQDPGESLKVTRWTEVFLSSLENVIIVYDDVAAVLHHGHRRQGGESMLPNARVSLPFCGDRA